MFFIHENLFFIYFKCKNPSHIITHFLNLTFLKSQFLLNLVFFLNYNPQSYHNDKHKSNYGRLIKELFFLAKPVEDLCGFT